MLSSFSSLLWQSQETCDEEKHVKQLCSDLGLSPTFGKILVRRGMCEVETVYRYLHPSSDQCHDPYLMRGMEQAVERVYLALRRREKVVIYGDYDVDGTAGTVILYRYFKRIGIRVHYFIPERLKDGYGMTESTLSELRRKKTNVIITVDNGSTAVEESKLLKRMGIDLIITDHHQLGTEMPVATAMLNPQQPLCKYPFKGLCGTGVAFKFLMAFDRHLTQQGYWEYSGYIRPDLQRDLDLVAFATVSDRVPLVDENRVYVQRGLELLNHSPRPGLQTLIRESNIRCPITPNVISFKLAPKINAVGRLADPRTGARLLLARSHMEARPYAQKLIEVNTERQQIERQVLLAASELAETQEDQDVIILVNENWHPGVVGSVAAKIAGRFHKTTVALTHSGDSLFVGSIRAVDSFDVCSALQDCSDFLEKFGGHKAAAGLSLLNANLNEFCTKFRSFVEGNLQQSSSESCESLNIDAWIQAQELETGLTQELLQMSPFGVLNPEPVLVLRNTKPTDAMVFGNNHLKFYVDTSECNVEVFAWDHSDWFAKVKGHVDIAMIPQTHMDSNGGTRLQFRAVDIKPTS